MTIQALLVGVASSKIKFNPAGEFSYIALWHGVHPSHDNIDRTLELKAASQSTASIAFATRE
jgi:hypothetical protein